MGRLIDADALTKKLLDAIEVGKKNDMPTYELEAVLDDVEHMPTVEERKKGKWLHKSNLGWGETWICSECGEKTTSTIMGVPRYKWCPMCGAVMEGEQDE